MIQTIQVNSISEYYHAVASIRESFQEDALHSVEKKLYPQLLFNEVRKVLTPEEQRRMVRSFQEYLLWDRCQKLDEKEKLRYVCTTLSEQVISSKEIPDRARRQLERNMKERMQQELENQRQRFLSKGYCVWFHGEREESQLIPEVLRQDTNSKVLLRELDYAGQHQYARGISPYSDRRDPREQEVTRSLVWTESAHRALQDALVGYQTSCWGQLHAPMVWVLDPVALNVYLYSRFEKCQELVSQALSPLLSKPNDVDEVTRVVMEHCERGQLFSMRTQSAMDGLLCLSAIEKMMRSKAHNWKERIKNGDMNAFFYLVYRYFVENVVNEAGMCLPPAAVVEPGSSNGDEYACYTVFPYNQVSERQYAYWNIAEKTDPRAMQQVLSGCYPPLLYQVRLTNPNRIVREVGIA